MNSLSFRDSSKQIYHFVTKVKFYLHLNYILSISRPKMIISSNLISLNDVFTGIFYNENHFFYDLQIIKLLNAKNK